MPKARSKGAIRRQLKKPGGIIYTERGEVVVMYLGGKISKNKNKIGEKSWRSNLPRRRCKETCQRHHVERQYSDDKPNEQEEYCTRRGDNNDISKTKKKSV